MLARLNIHCETSLLSLVADLYVVCNRIFNFSLALYLIFHGPGVVEVFASRSVVFVVYSGGFLSSVVRNSFLQKFI